MKISVNEEFAKWAKGYAGCDGGNMKGSIWFCGIEPGGNWDEKFEIKKAPPSIEESNWKTFIKPQYNSKILKIYSVLIGRKPDDYWKIFKESRAFAKDSDVFKMNLYPMNFKDDSGEMWNKSCYDKTGLPNKLIYHAWCQIERFPIIKSWVEENNPKAIICTGVTYKEDFWFAFGGVESLFDDSEEPPEEIENLKLYWKYINEGRTILFVIPFLGGRWGLNSDEKIEKFASKINDICTEKFGNGWHWVPKNAG